jgi:hypothetical protein
VHWLKLNNQNDNTEIKGLNHPWVTGIAALENQDIWMATYGGGNQSRIKPIKDIHRLRIANQAFSDVLVIKKN